MPKWNQSSAMMTLLMAAVSALIEEQEDAPPGVKKVLGAASEASADVHAGRV